MVTTAFVQVAIVKSHSLCCCIIKDVDFTVFGSWKSENRVLLWLDSGKGFLVAVDWDKGALLFLSKALVPFMKGSHLMIYQRPYLLIITWGVRIKTQVLRNANPSPLYWLAPQSCEGQRSCVPPELGLLLAFTLSGCIFLDMYLGFSCPHGLKGKWDVICCTLTQC